jgi:predicted DsbA family dithiol-disulfide isomerase
MDFQFPLLTSIFKAFCTDQKDIADVQVLSEIAENQGVMSKAEARALLSKLPI